MKSFLFLNIGLLFAMVLTQLSQSRPQNQLENQLENVNNQIIDYERMNFLNQNLNNFTQHNPSTFQHDIFDKIEIRKFTTAKIDLGSKLQKSSDYKGKQKYLQNLNFISTVSRASKKFEGLNFYTNIILQSFNEFYSFQGQNIFTLPSHDQNENLDYSPLIMISSLKNENFYTGQYIESDSKRQSKKCFDIKISQVQMRNKKFEINVNLPYRNLIINSKFCGEKQIDKNNLYSYFFTHNAYQNKPSHYIFANKKEINFYIYSEIAQQLVMDQNKTIRLEDIFGSSFQKIKSMVKLNTHLIVLTDDNNVFSINLISLLSSKKPQYIIVYETVLMQFQKFRQIHFNDNDFRFFYISTDQNIYQYKLTTQKIIKKYPLQINNCKKRLIPRNCTQNLWILQNYILVQQKQIVSSNKNSFKYFLIDKISGNWQQFHLPFSHENKCSNQKKIFLSKNKNSHYIITLACFLKEINSSSNSNLTVKNSQKSNYLILQHLNLETSNEVNPASELGGIDFTKFRLPMIVFSIGLVCYITVKRSSKKSPQRIAQQQKTQQKFQEEVLSTIRRQKQRQQALNMVRKKV